MILSEKDLIFIQQCEEKYPEKGIRSNITEFLEIAPSNRVQHAYKKMETVYRNNYDRRGIPSDQAETVFSNTVNIIDLAREITPHKNKNSLEKTIDIIWVHNIAKAIMPAELERDFDTGQEIQAKDMAKLDYVAVKLIAEAYPAMMDRYQDYCTGSSAEARYCGQLQKLHDFKTATAYAAAHKGAYLDDIVEQGQKEEWTSPAVRSAFEKIHLKR